MAIKRLALCALLPLLLLTPARAQDEADAELRSARAAFHTFAKAAAQAKNDPDKMKRALACLDLSEVDEAERDKVGRRRVLQLKHVLDQVKHLPSNLIPDDPKADAFVLYRDPDGIGQLELDRVGRNWLYTSDTVEGLPKLFTAVETRRKLKEAQRAGKTIAVETTPPPAPPKGTEKEPSYEHVHDWLRAHMPDTLLGRAFLLEYWQWLGLGVLALVGFLVHFLVVVLLAGAIQQALKRQGVEVDAPLTRNSVRPFGLLIMTGFWYLGLGLFGLNADVLRVATAAIKTVAAVAGVWGAYRLVDVISNAVERKAIESENKFDDLLVPLVRKSLKTLVITFGVVFVADTLNFQIKSLLAGLGLGGLAFALAAQDTVKNFFGSLTVVLDRPFEVGDWVLIDGVEGSVEELGFRSTRIRTFYNSLITLPNAKLLTAVVDNMGRRQYRRWKAKLGVAYHTTPDQLEALTEGIRELIRSHPYTRKDYFQVSVTGLGDSSIEILVYTFFETPDWTRELRERQRLILDMLRLCEALNIEIAFPTQTLHVVTTTEAKVAEREAEATLQADSTEQAQGVGRLSAQKVLAPAARSTARLAAAEKIRDRLRAEADEAEAKEKEITRRGENDDAGAGADAGE